jgi:hypothetical protein
MRCYIFTLDDCGSTLNAHEIDCNNAEEALQLGSAAVANDPVEVWCGPRRLARFESGRRQDRPLSRLGERLIVAERYLREGEQLISQQERVIAHLKREGRDLALAFSILDVLMRPRRLICKSGICSQPKWQSGLNNGASAATDHDGCGPMSRVLDR